MLWHLRLSQAKEYGFKDYVGIYSWILDADADVEALFTHVDRLQFTLRGCQNLTVQVQRRCPDAGRMIAPFKLQLPRLRASQRPQGQSVERCSGVWNSCGQSRLYLGSDDPAVLEALAVGCLKRKVAWRCEISSQVRQLARPLLRKIVRTDGWHLCACSLLVLCSVRMGMGRRSSNR